MAAASQLWYVPYRPDLVLLAPCDTEGPLLPGPGCLFVSVDHLHNNSNSSTSWRHPRATAFLTAFGDIATQQPRVVRCACGTAPCRLRAVQEGGAVPQDLIPADWATKYEAPPKDAVPVAPESRRASAVQLWLDCTARAERELPRPEGAEQPPEQAVLAAAEVMLTDYLKGRVCFQCSVPSTRMQRCSRCMQARYCSRECQTAHWRTGHKQQCGAAAQAGAAKEEEKGAGKGAEGTAAEAGAQAAAADKQEGGGQQQQQVATEARGEGGVKGDGQQ
ncbi:hypothetical protein Agub_g6298 [Astrephomene gubernaculifera]|uniref:MYND-type domain-containing protein n=1 Tax=Astrephomene gubernaculifera TaxID=47775 RepID=A0AAD3HKS5_9CHLO|nr:hypothetical protein Agub_g6298 [Astrephomene gubernaculifera]